MKISVESHPAASGESPPGDLSTQPNIARFIRKLPANARSTVQTFRLPNGGGAVQGRSLGRVPGSSAVYEKQIDALGDTISVSKTTYDPAGNIVHVKDKMQ
jgi:hypothetical protein